MYVFTGLSISGITVLRGMVRERKGPQITIGPKPTSSELTGEQKWMEAYGLAGKVVREAVEIDGE